MKFKLSVILLICLSVLIGLSVYFAVHGTPWGKSFAKKQISEYLGNKYNQPMTISQIFYAFDEGIYIATAYPQDQDDVKFRVRRNDDSKNVEFSDDYFINLWEYQVNSQLNPFVKNVFSTSDSGRINIGSNPIYKEYKNKVTRIPNYQEVKDNIYESSDIYISINRKFDEKNSETEYQKVFDVVQFVKEKSYKVKKMTVCFCENTEKFNEWVNLLISDENIQQITSKDDIKKYRQK
jgi:hypothetical protein